MKSLQKRRSTALILAVVWLAVCLVLTLAMGQTKATEDYEIKLLAAQKLQAGWMISGIISWKQDFPSLLMIRTRPE